MAKRSRATGDADRRFLMDALASLSPEQLAAMRSMIEHPGKGRSLAFIPLAEIQTNPLNRRQRWERKKIFELSQSIQEDGVLQPVLVRLSPDGAPKKYELISGERRFKAAQLADLEAIPAIIAENVSDEQRIQWMIVENNLRMGFTPVEEMLAVRWLSDEAQWTGARISRIFGREDESWAMNKKRLLTLPPIVLEWIEDEIIAETTARDALLPYVEFPRIMAALIADVESDIKHAIRQGKELKKGMRFWNNRDAAARRAKVLKSNSEKPRTWDALMMVEAELDGETPKRICNTYNQRYAAKIAKGDMKRATPAILKCEKNRRKAAE